MILDREEIKKLAAIQGDKCITVYIPTHKAGMEVNEGYDVIAYKNELQAIHLKLKQQGYEEVQIDDFMKVMFDLIKNDAFWKHQLDGLIVFRSPQMFNFYRVPASGKAVSSISSRFIITPVLPMLNTDVDYYLLAIGNKKVRLYHGTKFSLKEIEIPHLITENLEQVISTYDPEKIVQERTTRINYDGPIDTDYMPEGTGNDHSGKLRYEFEYFRDISNRLVDMSKPSNSLLVIAGIEDHLNIFKEANTHPNLLEEMIMINPERLDQQKLQQEAGRIVQDHIKKEVQKYIDRYHSLAGTGKTSYELPSILTDAYGGRVDTVFIERGRNVWGVFNEEHLKTEVLSEQENGSICLLNQIASFTIINSGNVIMLDRDQMPESLDNGAVAIYRY